MAGRLGAALSRWQPLHFPPMRTQWNELRHPELRWEVLHWVRMKCFARRARPSPQTRLLRTNGADVQRIAISPGLPIRFCERQYLACQGRDQQNRRLRRQPKGQLEDKLPCPWCHEARFREPSDWKRQVHVRMLTAVSGRTTLGSRMAGLTSNYSSRRHHIIERLNPDNGPSFACEIPCCRPRRLPASGSSIE